MNLAGSLHPANSGSTIAITRLITRIFYPDPMNPVGQPLASLLPGTDSKGPVKNYIVQPGKLTSQTSCPSVSFNISNLTAQCLLPHLTSKGKGGYWKQIELVGDHPNTVVRWITVTNWEGWTGPFCSGATHCPTPGPTPSSPEITTRNTFALTSRRPLALTPTRRPCPTGLGNRKYGLSPTTARSSPRFDGGRSDHLEEYIGEPIQTKPERPLPALPPPSDKADPSITLHSNPARLPCKKRYSSATLGKQTAEFPPELTTREVKSAERRWANIGRGLLPPEGRIYRSARISTPERGQ